MDNVSLRSQTAGEEYAEDVAVSPELWQLLLQERAPLQDPASRSLSTGNLETIRLAVCLSLNGTSGRRRRSSSKELKSLVCWACCDQGKHRSKEGVYISLSDALRTTYPSLLGRLRTHISICPTLPVQLSQIFLVANDEAAYEWSISNEKAVQDHLAKDAKIFRQGESVNVPMQKALVNGHAMLEPVLQGYVPSTQTEVVIVPPSATFGEQSEQARKPLHSVQQYDIDEDFLAASLMQDIPQLSLPKPAKGSSTPLASPSILSEADVSLTSSISARQEKSAGRVVPIAPLRIRPNPGDLLPIPSDMEDEHLQIFVRAADLGKHGFFSGDFVILRDTLGHSSRLLKIYADDSLALEAPFPSIAISPVLHFNMGTPKSLQLLAASNLQHANFSVARSVTIARVATAHSMHKKYQPALLSALKAYFQEKYRVVKQGDVIAVPLSEALVRFSAEDDEHDAKEPPEDDDEEPRDVQEGQRPSAVAFFKITELGLENNAATDPLTSGQLGLRIEPSSTAMVQTGLVNSLAPQVASFFDIDTPILPLPTAPTTHGPLMLLHLVELLQMTLRSTSGSLNLSLSIMLKGARGSGKATLARSAAAHAGFHIFELDCFDLIGETDIKTEGNLAARFDRAAQCTPCVLLLRHMEALARKSQTVETGQEPTIISVLQECIKTAHDAWTNTGFPLVLVGTVEDADKLPLGLVGLFKEELLIEVPDEAERLTLLEALVDEDTLSPDVSLKSIASQTAALIAGDLVDLVNRARTIASESVTSASTDAVRHAGLLLTANAFTKALEQARSSYSESIGAPTIPNVTWDDVGGLASVKTEILDTIQLPLEHPELFADGLKQRSGVLLYGPPGTGKTLLAKAVATSCSLNFFSVKGPELLNMYIGESEANVRRVFQRARDAKPCVIFFDELDSVAPKRGNQGDSGGVMDRIVSQLLAELDGMAAGSGGAEVFVIGATNRPDLLDPALLRPGRFDRMLYLGVSDTHEAQYNIIEALTRKFKLDPKINLRAVAEACPFNYTGADFYALCSDAMLKAMTRKAEEVDARIAVLKHEKRYSVMHLTPQYYLSEIATSQEVEVLVSQQDFQAALAELVPSVSEAEMAHYRTVQQRFSSAGKEEPLKATPRDKGKGRAVETTS